jgi:hypothetical protein
MSLTRNPSTVNDLLATTLELYADKLVEQTALLTPVTNKFLTGPGLKMVTGGESIVLKVNYANSGTFKTIGRNTALGSTQAPMYSQANLAWSGINGDIVRNDWDAVLNAGSSKMHDLFEADLENLKREMAEGLEKLLIGQVTATTADVWSLLDIVDSADPSVADYAGLDRDVYTWWAGTEVASGGIANVLESLKKAGHTAGKNGELIDFWVTTQTVYEAFEARNVAQLQLRQGDKADLAFPSLLVSGKPMFYSQQMVAATALGINLNHTKLYVQNNMKMKLSEPVRSITGQDEVRHIRTILQMVCDRPLSNCKVTGLS